MVLDHTTKIIKFGEAFLQNTAKFERRIKCQRESIEELERQQQQLEEREAFVKSIIVTKEIENDLNKNKRKLEKSKEESEKAKIALNKSKEHLLKIKDYSDKKDCLRALKKSHINPLSQYC